ncbi:MAG TPA: phosphoadenylyl-sulfate reductase [Blastocatellia bacterium]
MPEILDRAAETLEDRSPLEILEWAFEQFPGQLTLATAFGAEGIALIDMAVRVNPNVDIFSLDTGFFFPETYRLWDEVEKKYGISIRRMTPALSPTEQDQVHGPRLWERDPNLCCAIRKLAPLQHALAGFDGWITAIRRDQTPSRANAKTVEWDRRWQKVKMNPLARWARDDVWRYVIGNKLPYNPLHDVGYSSIGCTHCTRAVGAGEDERAGRWAGSEKTECGLHYETAKPGDRLNVELQALDRAPATLAVQGA